jgi:hypothetical protein
MCLRMLILNYKNEAALTRKRFLQFSQIQQVSYCCWERTDYRYSIDFPETRYTRALSMYAYVCQERRRRYDQENDRMVLTVQSQLCNPLAVSMSHQTRVVDHHARKGHHRPMSIQLSSPVKTLSHSRLSLHKTDRF